MKKLLIAGGSHSDIPLIRAAQALDYYVITTGNRPEDIGHRYSNRTILADFSDKEAMLSLAERLEIDAICSSSNDFSIISSAYVAQNLSLPGFDDFSTTVRLHHKDQFRDLAKGIGLPRVRSISFDFAKGDKLLVEDLNFPMMVKPVDLTGGKGIHKVHNQAELLKAVELALSISRLNCIVIEEFFEGSLHSYSTFIKGGKVIFDYTDNEFSFLNPYLVSTSTSPALVRESVLRNMRFETEKLALALNLVDGILHAQFLADGDQFRIIEYTRRMPGDFYSLPVKMSTGFDQAGAIIAQCCGVPIAAPIISSQSKFVSRHCAMASGPGIFAGVNISAAIAGKIVDQFDLKAIGDKIENPLVDKTAIYFLQYEDAHEMNELNQSINQLIQVKTN